MKKKPLVYWAASMERIGQGKQKHLLTEAKVRWKEIQNPRVLFTAL